MTHVTLHQLYQATAEQLTGKRVLVRFRQPVYEGLKGCCMADSTGRLVLDVAPYLGTQTLEVFLHECAHAKLHTFWPTDIVNAAPGSLKNTTPPTAANAAKLETWETEADRLTAHWLKIAEVEKTETETAALLRLYIHTYLTK